MIKVALFDMDGVLYDSMGNHEVAWVQSMKKFGINMTADDAYATEGARGVDTIRYMVRQQQGREITEAEAQTMYDEKSRIFHSMPEAPIMPGIIELMEQIQQVGISIGIVTGSGQRPLIARILKDFGKYVTPDHITTAYDVKRGKPNPDPYLTGLKKAGNLLPSEAIVIENAPLGVKAGRAAGIYTIAVNTGPLPDQVLLDAGANILFASVKELGNNFKKIILR